MGLVKTNTRLISKQIDNQFINTFCYVVTRKKREFNFSIKHKIYVLKYKQTTQYVMQIFGLFDVIYGFTNLIPQN